MWEQLVDTAVHVVGHPRKNVLQIRPRIMTMHLC
jgi:hypothetical protein